jgi:hypothetical protein
MLFLRYTIPSNRVMYFLVELFVTMTQSSLLGELKTHSARSRWWSNDDGMHTQRILWHALNPLVLLHGNACYVILADIIQMLLCFDEWSSVSLRQEV